MISKSLEMKRARIDSRRARIQARRSRAATQCSSLATLVGNQKYWETPAPTEALGSLAPTYPEWVRPS